ncbi:MAG: glycerophosphodiester phosphodiesterase [Myxococcota bacterium]|nr:glycerophosphodiester phosphodiesterase [Deltaproteobacteria bacterium]MCP4244356.1 glycerophosphodiester phosphodiesterase [bacterium]MDP6074858.1 glycerophosphodiester phosphodiesterase [Myxococcota bacterium]MDP6243921.1 glycerophosphodiester phosphodiesterase [Myxococcota bacterium]MDP7075233.1 glycerophosphodiester phosphodiesterase [Myxococcota bacterium]
MPHPYLELPCPLVIGHRGCAGEAPENTLIAFELGLERGAHILESDVHLTRDGVPVLVHDAVVDRVTEGTGAVSDFDLHSLQELDAGHRFETAAGHPYRGCGLSIPSLEEALTRFSQARFNLELKADLPAIISRSVDVVEAAGAGERVLLAAENDALMNAIHRELDARQVPAARGASASDVLGFLRAALDGKPPPPGPMALQVPAEFRDRPLVTPEFVAHAHLHGLHVHVWTINDPVEMDRFLDLGVDGIITDHPALLAQRIAART